MLVKSAAACKCLQEPQEFQDDRVLTDDNQGQNTNMMTSMITGHDCRMLRARYLPCNENTSHTEYSCQRGWCISLEPKT